MLIALLLCCIAAIFFFKSYYREDVSDDKLYQYVLGDNTLGKNAVNGQKVQCISDAVRSQYHQYFHHSGRVIVHTIVQMFSGVWGLGAFAVFNAILAIVAIALLVRLTQTADNRRSVIIWVLMAVALLYLFPRPDYLFYGIAYSMNYLFPIVTSTILFLLLRKLQAGRLSKLSIILFTIYAFFAGWTQEAFTVPISGGLFFWLIINRKKINFSIIPIIAFWLGTAMLVLAPGNFARLEEDGSIMVMFGRAINHFVKMKLIWLLLISLMIYCVKDKASFKFFLQA